MTAVERVVFDCNVYFQALISPSGPARRLIELAAEGRLEVYGSTLVLEELRDVVSRPHLRRMLPLADEAVTEFFAIVLGFVTLVENVPHVFDLPRDPDDAHYVNLAVATQAKLIISRDKDLLSLRDMGNQEGRDFRARFPDLEILTPPELMERLRD